MITPENWLSKSHIVYSPMKIIVDGSVGQVKTKDKGRSPDVYGEWQDLTKINENEVYVPRGADGIFDVEIKGVNKVVRARDFRKNNDATLEIISGDNPGDRITVNNSSSTEKLYDGKVLIATATYIDYVSPNAPNTQSKVLTTDEYGDPYKEFDEMYDRTRPLKIDQGLKKTSPKEPTITEPVKNLQNTNYFERLVKGFFKKITGR
jgi:hypothetical protein